MLKRLSKGLFPFLIAATALSVSGSAAYYSVTGLSKLFAGAAFAVIIMAGSLEVAKLVIASLLHQYWKTMNKLLRTYLTLATIILIGITSAGIYGFLSAAYQETATKSTIVDKQVKLLETKKASFQKIKSQYDQEKQSITKNISSLRNALGNNTQSYVDTAGRVITYSSSANRKAFERQLETAIGKDEKLTQKIQSLNDTIITLETRIVEVSSNAELASELGPLKYLSGVTGKPMDEIINILLLIIIFVFDPLAISLVVTANFAFKQAYGKKENDDSYIEPQVKPDKPDTEHHKGMTAKAAYGNANADTPDDFLDLEVEDQESWEEASLTDLQDEEPYKIYMSSSKDQDWEIVDEEKELLEQYDADGDGKIDTEEKQAIEKRIKDLQEKRSKLIKNPNISSWKKNKELQAMDGEISNLKSLLKKLDDDNDLVIKYT